MITAATVHQIHKVLRSCFRQAVKWEMMDKNPAIDATLPKYKAEEREIWTAEMLMQAIDACENKWLKVAFHLAFAATVRIGELLGLTWDCVDVSEEAIAENRAYIFINKQVERVSRNAVDELDAKEVILIFPSQRKNNKTVRLLKTPKTDTSERKVYIPKFLAQILVDIKKEQDELKDILGSEYQDYNLVMATTFGLPIGDSYLRDQMQKVIDEQGLPDVVFHVLFCFGYTNIGIEKCERLQKSISKSIHQVLPMLSECASKNSFYICIVIPTRKDSSPGTRSRSPPWPSMIFRTEESPIP